MIKKDKEHLLKTYVIYSNYEGKHDICAKIYDYLQDDYSEYYVVEQVGDIDRWDFPPDLLGIHRDWGLESQDEIIRWLHSRVVPKTRQFLDVMLQAHGLTHWDLDALLRLNKGKVTDDMFEVAIVENK